MDDEGKRFIYRQKKRAPKGPLFCCLATRRLNARSLGSSYVFDRQLDTAAVVHVQYQYFNFLTFFQNVSHFLNASVAQHGDVHQTVFARQDVDECAEVDDTLNLADVDFTDPGFRSGAQHAEAEIGKIYVGKVERIVD